MKVALVHDWLTGMRGGEKVLELMLELFPRAPVYTLLHLPGSVSAAIESHPIHSSFIQKLPGVRRHYRHYLPLFPHAIESLDLNGYDFILSSSHCVAKGVRIADGARHLCYCHTPMRYAWDQYDAYFGERRDLASRWLLPRAMARLRSWDLRSADRAQHYVANSRNVQGKIQRFWNVPPERTSVVHPPANTAFFTPAPNGENRGRRAGDSEAAAGPERPYYLLVSAMVPYKRLDLAIAAFRGGPRRLVLAGGGPDEARLRALAGKDPRIEFVGRPRDTELRELYRRARAFILPGEEDFGITPLEAQACGTPVIAYGRGGALETVVDGQTGVFFPELDADSLRAATLRLESLSIDPELLRRNAERFAQGRFKDAMEAEIESFLREKL